MNYEKAIEYNRKQANSVGWDPSWFDCDAFDNALVDAVADFQKECGLSSDGMCGPSTYRRKYTERCSELDEVAEETLEKDEAYLVFAGRLLPINWKKVVLWNEKGGLKTAEGHYNNMVGKQRRDIRMFVNHWDVCLSSKSCSSVLNQPGRSASIHLMVDNDATIYQSMDLQHIAWHASGRNWNAWSIGVEISNAYYPKYQSWYVRNGFGERPMVKGSKVHGQTLEDHLDFYDIQKEAVRAIWQCLHDNIGLPLEAPPVDTTYAPARNGDFRGLVHHYNLTSTKIDCGGWNIRTELDKLR
jgi:hypothetical protein